MPITQPTPSQTTDEMEAALGARLKTLRLAKNLDQMTLARRAGIGVSALKNLENGRGSTLRSLVSVVRALGRDEWLTGVAPMPTINPLTLTRGAEPRQRARRRKPATAG
jgi:transcriptional regulator with XRE-family HTH domain